MLAALSSLILVSTPIPPFSMTDQPQLPVPIGTVMHGYWVISFSCLLVDDLLSIT